MSDISNISDLIKAKDISHLKENTVNNNTVNDSTVKSSYINSIPTDNSIGSENISCQEAQTISHYISPTRLESYKKIIDAIGIEWGGVAQVLAAGLNDEHSLQYYKMLVQNTSNEVLMDALNLTETAAKEGKIKQKKVYYFLGILKKWGVQTKFKEKLT